MNNLMSRARCGCECILYGSLSLRSGRALKPGAKGKAKATAKSVAAPKGAAKPDLSTTKPKRPSPKGSTKTSKKAKKN